jgi:hypothetical protein
MPTSPPGSQRTVAHFNSDIGIDGAVGITRKQLNPYEEARAVKAMLDRGLTESGAAQALCWHKAGVSARLKLLELPERGQQLIGTGVIPLSAVDQRAQSAPPPRCSTRSSRYSARKLFTPSAVS